jgi:DNA invertase Pin-like site-specific DNA recombinase
MTTDTSAGALSRSEISRRAMLNNPAHVRLMLKARAAKREWSEEKKNQVRVWVAEGLSKLEMARRLGIGDDTLRRHAERYGIDLRGEEQRRLDAGAAVLKQHYASPMLLKDILVLYSAARGRDMSRQAMRAHAHTLRVRRGRGKEKPGEDRVHFFAEQRKSLIPRVQAMLDEYATIREIMAAVGASKTRLERMLKWREVVRPPPKARVPVKRARKSRAKPKELHQKMGRKPKALPASWVREEKPREPKPVFQSVEAWLAAGNQVKRCPTAAAYYTTAEIPEADRAALTAIYADRERAPKSKRRWNSL